MNTQEEMSQKNENISPNMAEEQNNAQDTATEKSDLEIMQESIDKLELEVAEQKDKYIRLVAEFENYKRRTAKEKVELIQVAGKDIIISMLEVLDDIERAEKQIETATEAIHIKEGVALIFNKFKSNLQSKGLQVIQAIHEDFDVERHEAVAEIPAPAEDLAGKVIDEVQKGYTLNDKIIRFSKVVVGK